MASFIIHPLVNASQKVSVEPDGKKSLFLLHKIVSLIKSGCGPLKAEDWQKTAGEIIDGYLKSPSKDPNIKRDLQGLTLVRSTLGSCIFKKIFDKALLESTGLTHIPSSLAENQEISLNQLYAEQFFIWMQDEIQKIPCSYILMLISIWQGFSDFSTHIDKEKWEELLSLKEWSATQRETLGKFKSKYEFLINFTSLQFPMLEIVTLKLSKLTLDENIKDRCVLWNRSVDLLIKSLNKEQVSKLSMPLHKIHKILLESKKNLGKEFIVNFKKLVFSSLAKLEEIERDCDEKISSHSLSFQKELEIMNKDLEEAEKGLEELDTYLKDLDNRVKKAEENKEVLMTLSKIFQDEASIKQKFQNLFKEQKKKSKLREKAVQLIQIMKSSRVQFIERHAKNVNNEEVLQKNNIAAVLFLSNWLVTLLEKEEKRIDHLESAKHIAYEASMQKTKEYYKKYSKKHLIKSLKKSSETKPSSVESSSIESESKESIVSTYFESSDSVSYSSDDSTSYKIDSFSEINSYLQQLKNTENPLLNGLLSRTLCGFLKQLRSHLLKIKISADLQVLYKQQTKEVHDHLLIGVAGLELIAQAIYDQRLNHVTLGFRDALIHCHYAVEQALSQQVILKTNKLLDKADKDHDLIKLAEKAQIADREKWEEFLKEINLHLAFSYPADYQIFFQQSSNLKALSLLERLSKPNLGRKETQEAVNFCFEMYLKSISFIMEIASARIKNQPKLLEVIQEVQEQIIKKLHIPFSKKIALIKEAQIQELSEKPLMKQVRKVLSHVGPVDAYFHLRNQKVYTAISTINSYLQLMETSLEIPQDSSKHSLQQFIKVETIAHIDKLFKHLFRAITLLQGKEDTHQHDLTKLFNSIASFYNKDLETLESIKSQLKEINLTIGHHYFHTRDNKSTLNALYSKILRQAIYQINVSGDEYNVPGKDKDPKHLKNNIAKITELVDKSFTLFLDLLEPAVLAIKEQFSINIVA